VVCGVLISSVYAQTTSVGTAQHGQLLNGFKLPLENPYISFYGKVDTRESNFATVELAALLVRAGKVVQEQLRGPKLTIGDCSSEGGGNIARHHSHNSGRDVDILFFVRNKKGKPIPAKRFDKFNKQGKCSRKGCSLLFDLPRNWWTVRTLLASEQPIVQYIFVSKGLKKLLLQYAKKRGEHPKILQRARRVMMQPKDSSPHNDHFHVRIYCSEKDRLAGCIDTGRKWPWHPSKNAETSSR